MNVSILLAVELVNIVLLSILCSVMLGGSRHMKICCLLLRIVPNHSKVLLTGLGFQIFSLFLY